MYEIFISKAIEIEGCPQSGLGAIDFRKANGLEPVPRSWEYVKCHTSNETICRHFARWLDEDADLILNNENANGFTRHRCGAFSRAVPPNVLLALQDCAALNFTHEGANQWLPDVAEGDDECGTALDERWIQPLLALLEALLDPHAEALTREEFASRARDAAFQAS